MTTATSSTSASSPLADSTGAPVRPHPKRANAKNWALTYPRCATSKQQALDNILSHFTGETKQRPKPVFVRIGQERHEDGGFHLHIGLWLESAVSFRPSTLATAFDFVCGKHGNYRPIESQAAWYNYLGKEDATPLEWGTRPPATSYPKRSRSTTPSENAAGTGERKRSKFMEVATRLISGSSVNEIIDLDPGFSLQHLAKIKQFATQCAARYDKKSLEVPPIRFRYEGEHIGTAKVTAWLNLNMFAPRAFKQPQLCIYGPANTRKTSLVLLLKKWWQVYHVPLEEDYYDQYSDQCDLCFLDELKGHKTPFWLNTFLQGAPMSLKQRYNTYLKEKNVPVIIATNYYPENWYKNVDATAIDTIKARLEFLDLTQWRDENGAVIPLDLDGIVPVFPDPEPEPPATEPASYPIPAQRDTPSPPPAQPRHRSPVLGEDEDLRDSREEDSEDPLQVSPDIADVFRPSKELETFYARGKATDRWRATSRFLLDQATCSDDSTQESSEEEEDEEELTAPTLKGSSQDDPFIIDD